MMISLAITLVSLAFAGFVFWKVFFPMMRQASTLMSSLADASQNRARLLATGAEGMGRILGVRETGTLVNNQPQVVLDLEVQSAQGQRFMAQCSALVSPLSVPRVQPGCTVPVRFDPANLANVAVVI